MDALQLRQALLDPKAQLDIPGTLAQPEAQEQLVQLGIPETLARLAQPGTQALPEAQEHPETPEQLATQVRKEIRAQEEIPTAEPWLSYRIVKV